MHTTRRLFLARTAPMTSLALSSLSLAQGATESAACAYEIAPKHPPNDGILFVDHSKTRRSGHLGHALVVPL